MNFVTMKNFVLAMGIVIVFWNVENFFLPSSPHFDKPWSVGNFNRKCDAVSKTLLRIADAYGAIPDIAAFAEVENRQVLSRLIAETPLRKQGYAIVHYDSKDARGIDCALIYRPETLELLYSAQIPLVDGNGDTLRTRDILLACFRTRDADTLAVLVNHHPSKLSSSGGGAADRRKLAMETLRKVADTLSTGNIVSTGDFNDGYNVEADTILPPVLRELHFSNSGHGGADGTIKFNGRWEIIDRIQTSPGLTAIAGIFNDAPLTERDRSFGGEKPARTFIGPVYHGGVSDHYPIIVEIQSLSTFTNPEPGF